MIILSAGTEDIDSYIEGIKVWIVNLPMFINIRDKKAMVNIKNNDPYCFLWSATAAAVFEADYNVCVASSYLHFISVLKYENLTFPMSMDYTIWKSEWLSDECVWYRW